LGVSGPDVEQLEASFQAALADADSGAALSGLRELYERFESGGIDAVATILHPDYELHMEALLLDGRVYKGVEGFKRWRRDIEEAFEYDRFEPLAVRLAGDKWVVLGRLHTKGKESGVELDVPLAHLYEQRDGKVVRLTMYADAAQALNAAGLRD
jgi:ketosteroid isomerase-like protein